MTPTNNHPKPQDDKDRAYWLQHFRETFKHSQFVNYGAIEMFLARMAEDYEVRLASMQEQLTQCYGVEGDYYDHMADKHPEEFEAMFNFKPE